MSASSDKGASPSAKSRPDAGEGASAPASETLRNQLARVLDYCSRLEIADLEHAQYLQNQKRLLDFVQRVTARMDDDDLMDVMVEEFLLELSADRVSYILVGDSSESGGKKTLAVSQEAVDRTIDRLPLPYFIRLDPQMGFPALLLRCLEKDGFVGEEWPQGMVIPVDEEFDLPMGEEFQAALGEEFNLSSRVECRSAMAFPVETALGGKAVFCVQRVREGGTWSRHQVELFKEMCRYAATLLDQTQLGNQVRELKDQLGSFLDSMPSAVIGMDLLGSISIWNGKAAEFFGMGEEEALGRVFWDIVPDYRFIEHTLREILQVQDEKGVEFEVQAFKRPDGTRVYHKAHLFTLFGNGRGEVGLRIDDVTRTEELNHQLYHSQRLETVGTLAGGLAHDFNNVLGGIVGTASLMKQRLLAGRGDAASLLEDLSVIDSCTARATAMVKRLLALSHRSESVMEPLDLNAQVEAAAHLCEASFESRIQVNARKSPDEPWILGDRGQIEQALLNLCVNARDAMKSGGLLTLEVRKVEVDDRFREKHPACKAGLLARISVRDTGEGIPLDRLDRIFDPFFTTKSRFASGLGLSMVEGIVKQHGGYVEVESDLRKGTAFHLYFNLAEKAARSRPSPAAQNRIGSGHILVVDDDELVRRTASRLLEELGFRVTPVDSGGAAIHLVDNGLGFDLVLLDVDMPVLNGLDTARILRHKAPDIRILFCTGRQHQFAMEDFLTQPGTWLLDKPYDLSRLSMAVQFAMAGGSSGRLAASGSQEFLS